MDPGNLPADIAQGRSADYYFYFVDVTAQKTYYIGGGVQHIWKIPRFTKESSKNFKVVVARSGVGYGASAIPVDQIPEIIAESNEITIERGKWEITTSHYPDHIRTYSEDVAVIGYETNQPLNVSTFVIPDFYPYYGVYLYNLNTSAMEYMPIAGQGNGWGSLSESRLIRNIGETETLRYQIYIAKRESNATTPDQLEDIQAVSEVVTIPPRKWTITIGETIKTPQPNNTQYITANFKTSRNVWISEIQSLYLSDVDTGKIVCSDKSPDHGPPQPVISCLTSPDVTRVKGIIAKRDQTVEYASQLQGVMASSDSADAEDAPPASPADFFRTSRFQNGSNPSTADCQQQCHGDPINGLNGELFENSSDLQAEGTMDLNFGRSYSSLRNTKSGPFGHGTTFSYGMAISGNASSLSDSTRLTVNQENGSTVSFSASEDGQRTFTAPNGFRATLSEDASGSYTFTRTRDQEQFIFDGTGRLTKLVDRIGNEATLGYSAGKLSTVSNGSSTITISWAGDLIGSITDGSHTVGYSYTDGNLTEVADSRIAAKKSYSYYPDNRIRTITHPNGGVYETTYGSDGRVSSQKDPRGGLTSFSYGNDLYNSVTQIVLPDGSKTVESYDSSGRLAQRVFAKDTADERIYRYSYSSDGELTSETTPSGASISYRHDSRGNLTYLATPGRSIYRFEYNDQNLLTRTFNPAGNISTSEYDTDGILVKSTDYDGKVTSLEHNSEGVLTSRTDPNGQKSGLSSSYSYGSSELLQSTTDTRGKTTSYSYDSARNPVKITDPLGNETEFSYQRNNPELISGIRYENGSTEEFSYDGAGRLTESVAKDGTKIQYSYDSMDNPLTVTTSHGTTSYEYDANQRLISTTNPKDSKTSYEYNGTGLLKKVTLPNGKSTLKEYSTDGLLSADVDAAGNRTLYGYGLDGRLEKITDPSGGVTRLVYDKLGNITQKVTPSGIWTNYSYSPAGKLKSMDEKSLRKTAYSYDDSGNLTRTTYADGTTELRSYDSEGNLKSVTDREGELTAYGYDGLNRATKEIRADQSEVAYSYDSSSNLISTDYGSGQVYENSYNLKDQLLESTTPEGLTTEYSYSPSGDLTSRGSPQDKVSYGYNGYGEVTSIDYPSGTTVDYSYDGLGDIQKVKLGADTLADYSYDDRYNRTGVSYGNGTTETTEFDALNRAKKIMVSNGSGELYGRSLDFDADSRISKAVASFGGTVTQDKSYQYSDFGTIRSSKDELSNVAQSHGYDLLNNLQSIGANSFSYDGSSSRLSQATVDGVTQSYSYDGRGNRTGLSSSTGTASYSWSKSNTLKSVELSPTKTVSYGYDAAGLLSSRSVSGDPTEHFSWDTVSGSAPELIEDSDFDYIYGADSTPFLQIDKSTGEKTYLYGDERGSVVLATAEDGSALWNRSYDEYGSKFTQTTAPGVTGAAQTRFGFAGEYLDPDTGLYNLRARWYDPKSASFLSVDPALLITGEPYSYGSGNPLSFTDPLGLWSMKDTLTTAAAAVDGLLPVPLASDLANAIQPGSVDNCSALYKNVKTVSTVGSFLVPGLGPIKAASMAAKVAVGATKILKGRGAEVLTRELGSKAANYSLQLINRAAKKGIESMVSAASKKYLGFDILGIVPSIRSVSKNGSSYLKYGVHPAIWTPLYNETSRAILDQRYGRNEQYTIDGLIENGPNNPSFENRIYQAKLAGDI